MPDNTATEMRELLQGLTDLRANIGNMGLNDAQQREVAERIDVALGGGNLPELVERVNNIVSNVDAMQAEFKAMQAAQRTMAFREGDGRIRLRAVNNPASDMPLYSAAMQSMIYRGMQGGSPNRFAQEESIAAAVRDGEPITHERIEAHFAAIEKRLGGLNPVLRHMQNAALGRTQ